MKFITILLAKFFIFIGGIFGKGTNFPGTFAYKFNKKILRKIEYPLIRIIVTGSSGKGSTTKLINDVLVEQGYTVTYNSSGANMVGGVLTTIIKDCNSAGRMSSDVLLLEMDERSIKFVYDSIMPTHVVITNLTKDQPPRQHDVEFVLEEVLKKLPQSSCIITNADDPFMRNIEYKTSNTIEYYSLARNQYSYSTQIFENLNTYHCLYCGSLLKYEYYNIESLGKYHCDRCHMSYKKPSVIGSNLDLENGTMMIDNAKVSIGGDVLYHAYNTLAAFTLLKKLNLKNDLVNSMNEVNKFVPSYFHSHGKTFYALNCKAENASTYNQVVFKASNVSGLKDYVIGWKEISRRYVHFDLSWLYDIEFELINDINLNMVYVCGIDAENIKRRLILAGIKENKICVAKDLNSIKNSVLASNANKVCGILNFDYMEPFKNVFMEVE